jgi:hypothetical protein
VWISITADLQRAHAILLQDAKNDDALICYRKFLDHNEFDLAMEDLAFHAESHFD